MTLTNQYSCQRNISLLIKAKKNLSWVALWHSSFWKKSQFSSSEIENKKKCYKSSNCTIQLKDGALIYFAPLLCCSVFFCVPLCPIGLLIKVALEDRQTGRLEISGIVFRSFYFAKQLYVPGEAAVGETVTHEVHHGCDMQENGALVNGAMVSWLHTQISGIPPMTALILQWP